MASVTNNEFFVHIFMLLRLSKTEVCFTHSHTETYSETHRSQKQSWLLNSDRSCFVPSMASCLPFVHMIRQEGSCLHRASLGPCEVSQTRESPVGLLCSMRIVVSSRIVQTPSQFSFFCDRSLLSIFFFKGSYLKSCVPGFSS